MQFQPTALILSASAQKEHFSGARLDTARSDTGRWDVTRFEARRAHPATPAVARDHRVRRSVAALLVRAAGVIEPCPAPRVAARG